MTEHKAKRSLRAPLLLAGAIALLVLTNVAWLLLFHSSYVASKVQPTQVHARFFAAENEEIRSGPTTPTVILFGDSRVAQWKPQPELGGGMSVVNRGRSGETTEQMRTRFRNDVLRLQPTAVIIQAGINDLVAASLSAEPLREQIMARCLDNLEAFTHEAAASGIRVLLLRVIPPATPPLYRRPFWSASVRPLVEQVNTRLASVDFGRNVIVLDVSEALMTTDGEWLPDVVADTLHFSAAGYARINTFLYPTLQALTRNAVQ